MIDRLIFRKMRPQEEDLVSEFVLQVFQEYIAPLYPSPGADQFLRYAAAHAIARRQMQHHLILLALHGTFVKGMIELRDCSHISMFFVQGPVQASGIGRELLRRGIEISRRKKRLLSRLTVNASPNALSAYERLGFTRTGPEQMHNGVLSVPMVLVL